MSFIQLADIQEREQIPGFWLRAVHSDSMTLASWNIKAGASLPAHSHPHEQITMVLEGEFELTMEGETRRLGPGGVAVIPGNVPHAGHAINDCRLIDAFSPTRDDLR